MHLRDMVGQGPASMTVDEFKERLAMCPKLHKSAKKAKSNRRKKAENLVGSLTDAERTALAGFIGAG